MRASARENRADDSIPSLSLVEEEALNAIQLLDGGSDGWVDIDLFAHGFAPNLAATLRSLDRKKLITFSQEERRVQLK